jgi:Sec-independent protein secretion pathway component TatC
MEPLDWFAWIWSGIPLILFFVGGVLSTLFGILAFAFNVRVFRSERSNREKYLLTALNSIVSAGITYGLPVIATPLINLVFHKS